MDRATLSDEQLVALCQQQLPYNTEAFAVLVARYEARVFDMCARYLGDAWDAEEIAQNVFMKVFHSLKGFQRRSAFRTWIFRITANECATRYRKRKRRIAELEAYAESLLAGARYPDPDVEVGGHPDLGGPLGLAWRVLSETDRAILTLRYIAELSIADTAETLGIGLSAAKMRLYRAEDRLRHAYDKFQRDVTFSPHPAVSPEPTNPTEP